MRIEQLYCRFAKNHFEKGLVKKYALQPYSNPGKPAIFFGAYSSDDWKFIWRHADNFGSLAVVIWAGSDIMSFVNERHVFWVELFRRSPNIKHIAISPWIESDLSKINYSFYSLPILPMGNQDIEPAPRGGSIYMYKPDVSLYNGGIYQKVKELIPYKFIEADFHTFQRAELLDVYKDCFMGVRFTQHDGLSNTVCELGLMGRRVVWNGNTPNAINYNSVEDVINSINSEYKKNDYKEVAAEVKDFLDIGQDWLDTDYYA